jgi:hypothetical protein
MTAQTTTLETTNTTPRAASWMSRLSLRPSSLVDGGQAAPESLVPGGAVVRTVVLCCALALSAVALRGMVAQVGPQSFAAAGPAAASRTFPAGD